MRSPKKTLSIHRGSTPFQRKIHHQTIPRLAKHGYANYNISGYPPQHPTYGMRRHDHAKAL